MKLSRRGVLAGALAVSTRAAEAQAWPTRSIRMIVPFAPAATGDIAGRLYAEELSKSLGQPVIVDNRTGAGGTIAMAELARAPADGYTIAVISQGTVVWNIGLYKTPGYAPLKDLAPIALSVGVSNVLILPPSNPAKTVADVLAQARAKPGEFTYSSGGVGTSHHMSGVMLELRTGLKLLHVPYRATPAGIMAVANGEVQMGLFNTPTVISLIQGGKLKAIAVTSEQRSKVLPELPTMIESGINDYVVDTWLGFAAPAGTPEPVIARLNAEINRIGQLPQMREKMLAQGIDPLPAVAPEAVQKLIKHDFALWLPIIKSSGASAE